ncbi:MAG: S8 family serine peptidase [Planctomycetota bacterium]
MLDPRLALLALLALAPARPRDPAPAGPGPQRFLLSSRETLDRSPLRAALAAGEPAAAVLARIEALGEAARARDAAIAAHVAGLGGRLLRSFWLCDVALVEVPPDVAASRLEHPDVWRVERDEPVGPAAAPCFTDRSIDARNHNALPAHSLGIRGKGVVVAILDTGQDEDMDGKGRPHALYYPKGDVGTKTGGGIGGSRLLANFALGKMKADDVGFHGTAVCGILAGARWNANPRAADGQAPEAGVLGYSLAVEPTGTTDEATLIKAWEQVVTDRAKYGTRVVNNSYLGSPDPLDAVQQVLDSAAETGGLLVTVPAGNLGASTQYSQSCANGLAVGATHPDTHRVAVFSSRGPLAGDPQRDYPDLCANGANLWMPKTDDEAGHYVTWGTSMAAPQVAGAAALFFEAAPKADALQCKAAILATTDDVSAENPTPPYDTVQAFGQGYLRTDRLVDLARSGTGLYADQLDTKHRTRDLTLPVVKGARYAVVVAWNRHDLKSKTWDDLSLRVLDGSTKVASADRPRNLYEKLLFVAPRSGNLTLRVAAATTPSQQVPFGVAVHEVDTTHLSGSVVPYGDSCRGTGPDEVRTVVPTAYEERFGTVWSDSLLGGIPQRFQQLIDAGQVPEPFKATGLALRLDDAVVFEEAEYWIDLELRLGATKTTTTTMSTTFQSNWSTSPEVVLAQKRISLPIAHRLNPSPKQWAVRIPFDKAFSWGAVQGEHLLLEALKTASEDPTRPQFYFVDAFYEPKTTWCSVLGAPNPTATTGLMAVGSGLVLGFTGAAAPGAWPTLDAGRVPQIGLDTDLWLEAGRESSVAALFFGLDDRKFNNIDLPIQLGPLGAPDCWSLASIDHMHALSLDKQGGGAVTLPLPRDPALVGGKLYSQAAVLDLGANKLGLVLTNGVALTIGGDR